MNEAKSSKKENLGTAWENELDDLAEKWYSGLWLLRHSMWAMCFVFMVIRTTMHATINVVRDNGGWKYVFRRNLLGFMGGHNRSCMFDGKCWWRVLGSSCFLIETCNIPFSRWRTLIINGVNNCLTEIFHHTRYSAKTTCALQTFIALKANIQQTIKTMLTTCYDFADA